MRCARQPVATDGNGFRFFWRLLRAGNLRPVATSCNHGQFSYPTRSTRAPIVAFGPADGVPLLEGRGLVDGKPAVYICERFACRAPAVDPAEPGSLLAK
jgi:hypothetical protein